MRVAQYMAWYLLPLGLASPLSAQIETIDFENLSGPSLVYYASPPVHILSATFFGGTVATNETFNTVDQTSVYATTGFCSGCDPIITIEFNQGVSDLTFLLMNGRTLIVTYEIEDDEGNRQFVTLPENFNDGATIVSIPDSNVHNVSISSTATGWDFAIDNVSFMISGPVLIDPVAGKLLGGLAVSNDPDALASSNAIVQGVAADGRALAVVRIPATEAGDTVTVTVVNDQGQESDSVGDDGGLLPVGGGGLTFSQIQVTAVDTSQGPMAFALYQAPLDFSRGTADDNSAFSRNVSLDVVDEATGVTSLLAVEVVRPPVVLIHGLWADTDSWNGFSPPVGDSRFISYRVDYSGYIGSPVVPVPPYPPSGQLPFRRSAMGFAFNAGPVLTQLENFVANFSHDQNVAATQADVVAHSMGGDIARFLPLLQQQPSFLSAADYGYGPIHKLITIGTPHLGSPLATQLLANANSCVAILFNLVGNSVLSTVDGFGGGTANGAVGDLAGDGVPGGSLSPALSSLPAHLPFPIAYISGQMGESNLAGLNCSIGVDCSILNIITSCNAVAFRCLCGNNLIAAPLAVDLTATAWPSLFGQASDAIVPMTSQVNGTTGTIIGVDNVVHSPGTEDLSFNGPSELDTAGGVPMLVLALLNARVNDNRFHS
jgi:pimeloyl-ACP methyl ester carboxylesterase